MCPLEIFSYHHQQRLDFMIRQTVHPIHVFRPNLRTECQQYYDHTNDEQGVRN